MARVPGPGSGYGFSLARMGEAIFRYVSSRFQNTGPWGITRTIKSVARYFFDLSDRVIRTISEKGEAAYQAGRRLTRMIKDSTVPRKDIPVDTSLPRGVAYRAKVLVSINRNDGSRPEFKTVTMDFDRNPSPADVLAKVQGAAEETILQYPRFDPAGNMLPTPKVETNFEQVLGIVRRTY